MSHPFYLTAFWLSLRSKVLKRDRYRCTVPGCTKTSQDGRLIVDHIRPRPHVPYPTEYDVMSNLRTLCAEHDNQVKEGRSGRRANNGRTFVRGCDANGQPLDPMHHWRRG